MKTDNLPTDNYKYQDYANIDTGYQAVRWHEPIIYELSREGSCNDIFPETEKEIQDEVGNVMSLISPKIRRKAPPAIPELSEPEIMRHYLRLSQQTFGYDSGVNIGLGTCTMKYSPKVNEQLARMPKVTALHPLQPEDTFQGLLEIMYELRNWLCELSGMAEFSFLPRGGGHGVYTNARIMRAIQNSRGNHYKDEVITCAVSHPCNAGCPSSAGYKVIELHPDKETGDIGMDQMRSAVSERTAGLFLTAPYDTGVFDSQIGEYAELIHSVGGLVSLDQANFNGVMTRLRAGDIGADLMHFNLHKTFSTPHGSAGPATGAIGIKKEYRDYLPVPIVDFDGKTYHLNYNVPNSIGKTGLFYGVTLNVIKAYSYIMAMGAEGLRSAAEWAVINNNYLIKKMLEVRGVGIAWPNRAKLQEARFHLQKLKEETGIGSADVNLRIGDYGVQTYFESHEPVIIAEPVTPEASETASKEDLDRFVEVFHRISEEAYTNPEIIKTAPHRCTVHQSNMEPFLNPKKTLVTWRAYKKKGLG